MRATALLLMAATLACRPAASDTATPEGGPGSTLSATAVDRATLADAIDPGPQPPLSDGLPAFALAAVGVQQPIPGDVETLVALTVEQLDAWERIKSGVGLSETLELVMGLARAVVYAERAVALGGDDPRVLGALERLYHIVDAPLVAHDRALFSDMVGMFVQASAARGLIKEAAQIEAVSRIVFGTVKKANAAHRRAVAALLRSSADDATVAEALWRAAEGIRREDDVLGVRVARASVILAGDDADAKLWFGYAGACHRALQLDCGGEALAQAEAKSVGETAAPKDKESLEYAHRLAKAAHDAVELRGETELQPRVRQAHALLELSRTAESEAAFRALRADFPREAAPVTGLAMHAVNSRLDLSGAAATIDEAGPNLLHRDEAYYEIAVGTRATRLVYDVLPQAMAGRSFPEAFAAIEPMVDTIRADVAALEALGSARAVALRFVLDVGLDELMPLALDGGIETAVPTLRGLLARAVKVRGRVPADELASRLVLATAQFSADEAAAFAAVLAPLPEASAETLRPRQTGALLELSVMWESDAQLTELLTRAEAQAKGTTSGPALLLLGDAWALVARQRGRADAWVKAEDAYRRGLDGVLGSQRERPLNNLAVAVAEQGRTEQALHLWQEASAAGGEEANRLSEINRLATGGRPGARARLVEIASGGGADSRRFAQLWLTQLGTAKERRQAEAALAALLREQIPGELRPRLLPTAAGVALAGSLNAGLGYSTVKGLVIDLSVDSEAWLLMRPPSGLPFE
jgi:hypothetical protein